MARKQCKYLLYGAWYGSSGFMVWLTSSLCTSCGSSMHRLVGAQLGYGSIGIGSMVVVVCILWNQLRLKRPDDPSSVHHATPPHSSSLGASRGHGQQWGRTVLVLVFVLQCLRHVMAQLVMCGRFLYTHWRHYVLHGALIKCEAGEGEQASQENEWAGRAQDEHEVAQGNEMGLNRESFSTPKHNMTPCFAFGGIWGTKSWPAGGGLSP